MRKVAVVNDNFHAVEAFTTYLLNNIQYKLLR